MTHATFSLAKNGIDASLGGNLTGGEVKEHFRITPSPGLPTHYCRSVTFGKTIFELGPLRSHSALYSGIKYKEILVKEK